MRTIRISSCSIAAVACLAFGATALAQTASPVLNALEVRKLVASTEPGDNARLSAHFAALAGNYEADARRHNAMAQAFSAAPTRPVPANTAADHYTRLAAFNRQSAETLRELAAHHERLAAGVPSTAPRGAARFHAGAGAPEPSDAELRALAAQASTPADHRFLEEYFLTAAKRYTADADQHVAMAQAYRGTRIAQAAAHCDRLVALARDSAKEARAAAEMHRQLAKVGR
jgi:hypothetical protein